MCRLRSCFEMLGRIGGSWGVDRDRLLPLKRGAGVASLALSMRFNGAVVYFEVYLVG